MRTCVISESSTLKSPSGCACVLSSVNIVADSAKRGSERIDNLLDRNRS